MIPAVIKRSLATALLGPDILVQRNVVRNHTLSVLKLPESVRIQIKNL